MGRDDEFTPDIPLVEAVINDAICPVLKSVEKEYGVRLAATMHVWVQDLMGPAFELNCSPRRRTGGKLPVMHGQARIHFRRGFQNWRKLFFFQAIFPGSQACPEFGGFDVKGEVQIEGGVMRVVTHGRSVLLISTQGREEWEWDDWV